MSITTCRALTLTGAAMLAFAATAAVAQGAAPAAATADDVDAGAITVTAQRISQNVQDVPLAISAFGAADLDRRQITGLRNLATLVPGLYIEENLNNTSTPKLFMRGIGIDNSAFSFDSPVGVYVDDVYYPRAAGTLIDFFDIDRIEVLRGPQGTIYGRNSSIGAVRVITKKAPLEKADLKADVTYGTRNQFNIRASVGVPLIEDKLGFRFAYNHKENDGFQTNLATGERVKSDGINAYRGQLLFKPSDDLSITLRGDWLHDRSRETAASRFLNDPDNDLLTFFSNKSYRDGTAINKLDTYGTSATVNWAVGDVDITSITAWRGIQTKKSFDADGTVNRTFEIDRGDLRERAITQELFASGNDIGALPVSWVAGAFFLHEKSDYVYAQRVISAPSVNFYSQTVDTPAGYGQLIWRATDRLSLTGGLRYTFENKDFSATGFTPAGTQFYTFNANNLKKNKWTWRLGADYKITDDILLFGSASTGFRSGGLNGNATTLAEVTSGAFGPESTRMYEGGFKSAFFNRRVIVNASYYFGKYSGLQQAITLANGQTSSVNNDAKVRGLDFEATVIPTRGLFLSGTLATFHSNVLRSALILKQSAKLTYSVNGTYELPLSIPGKIALGATYRWSDKVFENTANTAIIATPSRGNVDAFASYALPGDRWKLTGGVLNATDKVYSAGGFFIANGAITAVKYPTLPRRYYVTAQYQF